MGGAGIAPSIATLPPTDPLTACDSAPMLNSFEPSRPPASPGARDAARSSIFRPRDKWILRSRSGSTAIAGDVMSCCMLPCPLCCVCWGCHGLVQGGRDLQASETRSCSCTGTVVPRPVIYWSQQGPHPFWPYTRLL